LDRSDEVEGAEVEARFPRHEARELDQLVEEPGLREGVALDRLEGALAAGGVERARAEEPRPAEDRVERGAEVVRGEREEVLLRERRLVVRLHEAAAPRSPPILGARRGRARAS